MICSSVSRHSAGVSSVHRSRPEMIFPGISNHIEKGLVGIDDSAVNIPYHDPDDVRIDQTSDPGLTLLEIVTLGETD